MHCRRLRNWRQHWSDNWLADLAVFAWGCHYRRFMNILAEFTVTFIIRFFQIFGVASLIVGSTVACFAIDREIGVLIVWLIWLSLLGAAIATDL
jgi:hypothetical protein